MVERRRKKFSWRAIIAAVLVVLALNFIRLPYFVQRPGEAKTMNNMVQVSGGYPLTGDYRLVYIYIGQANIFQYLWAQFDGNKYTTLIKENQIKMPNEDDAAYTLRQKNYMTEAQQSAAYVAYKAAGKEAKLIREGVLILDVMPSMPSAKVLKSGDVIVGAEGRGVSSTEQLNALVEEKRIGQPVNLKIRRGSRTKDVTVRIARFPKNIRGGGKESGIGIFQSDQVKVDVRPSVHFNIGNIGGPSAGLMMTLQIYDQLTRQDLAKKRDIAGTGTIEMNGHVGPIGGISEKVVGASRSGADVFFAPTAQHEAEEAQRTAEDIGTGMKIVPVSTFQDALDYLKETD
ncbi:PDZ domain-containing protein [Sporolactobacillus sp. THM7-7]|nr:PDZ domain-containing protein [Sporolactobacillus sp. THM7-7]